MPRNKQLKEWRGNIAEFDAVYIPKGEEIVQDTVSEITVGAVYTMEGRTLPWSQYKIKWFMTKAGAKQGGVKRHEQI